MRATVMRAVAMKTGVATSERGERRETPHTPCPLGQPEPSRVPNPTSRPPATRIGAEDGKRGTAMLNSIDRARAPRGRQSMKAAAVGLGAPDGAMPLARATNPL